MKRHATYVQCASKYALMPMSEHDGKKMRSYGNELTITKTNDVYKASVSCMCTVVWMRGDVDVTIKFEPVADMTTTGLDVKILSVVLLYEYSVNIITEKVYAIFRAQFSNFI